MFDDYDGDHTGKPMPKAGPKIRHRACGDVIQSMHRHDFKWCKCKGLAVDGGGAYLRMVGDIKNYDVVEA